MDAGQPVALHLGVLAAVSVGFFVVGYGALIYMLVTHDRPFSGETIVSHQPITEAYAHQMKSFQLR